MAGGAPGLGFAMMGAPVATDVPEALVQPPPPDGDFFPPVATAEILVEASTLFGFFTPVATFARGVKSLGEAADFDESDRFTGAEGGVGDGVGAAG